MADEKLLKEFWVNEAMRNEVREFLFAHLDKQALNKVYNKDDTHGIADARETIRVAFAQLDDEFTKKPNKKERLLNQAR